jgi:hypothetical protein
MSKTVSVKGTCQYVIKNGKSKGKKCGASCRDKFCFKHKEKTILNKKVYYSKHIKKETIYPKVLSMIDRGIIPNEEDYCVLLRKKQSECEIFIKKYYGILLFLGQMSEDQIISIRDRSVNKEAYKRARIDLYKKLPIVKDYLCNHEQNYNDFNFDNDFVEYFGEEFLLKNLMDQFTDKETGKVDIRKISEKQEEYVNTWCRKRPTYFKFTGSKKEANAFISNSKVVKEKLIDELKDLKKTIDLINETKIKLLEKSEDKKQNYELKPVF